jgi:hypothetical protein
MAASVQVKARTAPTTVDSRERTWLDKNIEKAARQATGTIRSLRTHPATLTNERGRQVLIGGTSKSWTSIVVVSHVSGSNALVLLRRDWEFLFEQLKSTDAVLRYVQRVTPMEPIALGEEPVRFYRLAAADHAADPGPLDPRLNRPGVRDATVPLLPQIPAASDSRKNHYVIRAVLEDLALCPRPADAAEADILEVLAAIDTLAVGYRSELGKDLLSWMADMKDTSHSDVRWHLRRVNFPERPHLIFGAANQWNQAVREAFSWFVEIRHQQLFEALGDVPDLLTAGVLQ